MRLRIHPHWLCHVWNFRFEPFTLRCIHDLGISRHDLKLCRPNFKAAAIGEPQRKIIRLRTKQEEALLSQSAGSFGFCEAGNVLSASTTRKRRWISINFNVYGTPTVSKQNTYIYIYLCICLPVFWPPQASPDLFEPKKDFPP